MCSAMTNRIVQFRDAEDAPWTAFFFCDACTQGIKEMPVRPPVDA